MFLDMEIKTCAVEFKCDVVHLLGIIVTFYIFIVLYTSFVKFYTDL